MVTFPQHRYCVSLSSRYGLNGEKHDWCQTCQSLEPHFRKLPSRVQQQCLSQATLANSRQAAGRLHLQANVLNKNDGDCIVLRFNCGQSYCSVFTIASNCSTSCSLCQAAVYSLLANVAWHQSLLIGKASASPPHGH